MNVEPFFICLFVICIPSLVRCLAHFSTELFSYCWNVKSFCIFSITILYQMWLLQISSPRLWLVLFCWYCLLQSRNSFFGGWGGVLHPQHMGVPKLGTKWELQLSSTYTTAHSNTGSLTHWVRPGIRHILMDTSRICFHCATVGTLEILNFNEF